MFDNEVGVGIFHQAVNSLSFTYEKEKNWYFFLPGCSATQRIQNSSHECIRKQIARAYITDKISFVQDSKINGNHLDILEACFREKILKFVKSTLIGS